MVILLLTFLAALFAGYQAYRLATQTERLANETSDALKDARKTADQVHADSMATTRAQIRPWMRFGGVASPLKEGSQFQITIEWQNVGHSPAHQARSYTEIPVILKGQTPPGPMLTLPMDKIFSVGVFLPGPPSQIPFIIKNEQPLTKEDVATIRSRAVTVWIVGRMEYLDDWKQSHFTMFRGQYDPVHGTIIFSDTGTDAN